jgi:hypothetical protein
MRVTSASASANSLVASAASLALCEPVRREPGITRIFGITEIRYQKSGIRYVSPHVKNGLMIPDS